MRLALSAALFVIAAAFAIALLVGVAIKVVFLIGAIALLLVGVGFIMRRLRGPSSKGVAALESGREPERIGS